MELWWWKAGEPECFTKDFLFFFFTALFSFPPGHSNLQVYTRQTTAEFLRVDSLQLLNVASRGLTRFDLKAQSTSPVEINEKSSLCSSLFPSNELYIYMYICISLLEVTILKQGNVVIVVTCRLFGLANNLIHFSWQCFQTGNIFSKGTSLLPCRAWRD